MPDAPVRLVCQGCGQTPALANPLPFRCAHGRPGDDVDHLLAIRWRNATWEPGPVGAEPNPFIAFRQHSYAHAVATEHGMHDGQFVALVRELDDKLAATCGTGFRITPWGKNEALDIWFKDETANVAGSHKARHLFGILLYLEVVERVGLVEKDVLGTKERPLVIASCGNAALAAAVIAHAAGRVLRVFIPTWADAKVVAALRELEAEIVTCERAVDSPPGDPCFHAFRKAVGAGAVAFTCQGSENGLVIDGGKTLGFEIARQQETADAPRLEHLFVQVGGGALASATCQALEFAADPSHPMAAIHAVQTLGCHPIADAWRQLANDLRNGLTGGEATGDLDDPALARWLLKHGTSEASTTLFEQATRRRSRYMRPVKAPAASIATGILDDETYDWFAICQAMIRTGGWPVIVTEKDLAHALESARSATGINVDATGSSGLAGLQVARRDQQLAPGATAGVLFTGVQR